METCPATGGERFWREPEIAKSHEIALLPACLATHLATQATTLRTNSQRNKVSTEHDYMLVVCPRISRATWSVLKSPSRSSWKGLVGHLPATPLHEHLRQEAKAQGCTFRTGPELEITGYGCEDVDHGWTHGLASLLTSQDHFLENDTFLLLCKQASKQIKSRRWHSLYGVV